jgi:hypothetical protein
MEGNIGALAGWVKTGPATGAPSIGIYSLGWSSSGQQYGWQNYSAKLSSSNSTYSYQPAYAGFGYVNGEPVSYAAVFDWFRVRAFPPIGVMPFASFESIQIVRNSSSTSGP